MREGRAKVRAQKRLQTVIADTSSALVSAINANKNHGVECNVTVDISKFGCHNGKRYTVGQLIRIRKLAGRKVKHSLLKVSPDVAIAFDMSIRAADTARAHHVDRKTIKWSRKTVAGCLHEHDLKQLRGWKAVCLRKPPLMVILTIKWDEAKSTMKFPVKLKGGLPLNNAQSIIPLHVLQSARKLVMAWDDRTVEMELKSVPIPLVNTNASTLYNGLELAPGVREIAGLIREIQSTAEDAITIEGEDGASSNKKYSAWRVTDPRPDDDSKHDSFWCGNHNNFIIEVCCRGLAGQDLKHRLDSMTSLMRTGTYYARVLAVLENVVDEKLVVKMLGPGEQPPQEFASYADELLDFIVQHRGAFRKAYGEDSGETAAEIKYKELVTDFVTVFNGCLWLKDMIVHHCRGSRCCPGGRRFHDA